MISWSIRPAERTLTASLAAYFFLVVGALYLVKPARNALFLEGLGANRLPFVYIATAFVTWWVVAAYVRVATRATLLRIVQFTLAATVVSLVAFWLWLARPGTVALGSFYVWVKIYGVLLPSQFWLLSEGLLDPRQARRLFGPIGAGGIAGGIFGSAVAGFLAQPLGTRNLLLIAALSVAAAALILRILPAQIGVAQPGMSFEPISRGGREERLSGAGSAERDAAGPGRPSTFVDGEQGPADRRLVVTIAAILIVGTMAHTIVDWQFNKAAEEAIRDVDARTAFFGGFFTVLNGVTLAIQLLATSFILRFFGIGVALALLPVALGIGAGGILLAPALWSASLARGADDALRYSIDQSARELLFLPISPAERQRIKPRIDLIAHRAANGLAGALILGSIWLLGDSIRLLSVLSILLVGCWLYLVVQARRRYTGTLEMLLHVRDPAIGLLGRSRLDADAADAIRRGLASADRATVHTAIELAGHTDPGAFIEGLRGVLRTSDDAELKAGALRLLTEAQDRTSVSEALANIDQSDRDLTAQALAYAWATGDQDAEERIAAYLAGDDPLLAATAAACLLDHDDPAPQQKGVEILRQAVAHEGARAVELRLAVVDVIRRRTDVDGLRGVLTTLLRDEAPQVVRAALTAAAGNPHADLIGVICSAGTRSGLQSPALEALQLMEASAVGPLTGILADPRNGPEKRSFAARVLGRTGGRDAAAGLVAGLVADDRKVRRATLKALNYMRRRGEKLRIGRDRELAAIRIEWTDYLSLHRQAAALETPGTDTPTAFVATVVEERLHESEEQLFRALALLHPIQPVFFAYRGLITGDRAARAHAIELVDSVIETPERRPLVRLLESESRAARGRIAAAELDRPVPTTGAALEELLDPGDPWLAACAILALGADHEAITAGRRQDLLAHRYPPLTELLTGAV